MSTFIHDFKNSVVCESSIRPQAALTADTNGVGVDLQLTDGPVFAIVSAGDIDLANADETYSFKLQESDASGGTYTDIAGATATITADNTTALISTNQRTKRWVRAVLDVGGTTPSILCAVLIGARKKLIGGSGTVTS